jgi:cell division septation protein DedD
VAAWFYYAANATTDFDTASLPARPQWTSAMPQIAAPPPLETVRNSGEASALVRAAVHEANDGSFAIQVASFESRSRADRLVTELAEAGFRARTVEFNLGPPRGVVLQIRVEGYTRAQDAERDLSRIRELPGYEDAHLLSN